MIKTTKLTHIKLYLAKLIDETLFSNVPETLKSLDTHIYDIDFSKTPASLETLKIRLLDSGTFDITSLP